MFLTVSDLGERLLIKQIWELVRVDPEELLGAGLDDAVAKEIGEGLVLVAHTDVWVEKSDLLPGMSWYSAGRKAVVANISDIASKGARPLGVLFSIGLPSVFPLESFRELVRGLGDAITEYGTYLLGGDLSESCEVTLAGFIVGLTHRGKLLSRRGAKPGDMVATTGNLGLTSVGFKILLEGFEAPEDIKSKAVESLYKPVARLREGLALAGSGAVAASMDISDGLALSLNQLAEVNGVKIVVEDIPVTSEAEEFSKMHGLDVEQLILYGGGEEYELLLAVKPDMWAEAVKTVKNVGGMLYKIGVVEEGSGVYTVDGEKIEAKGWEHFIKP
ncbi:thiamine-phosphate kinase [Candidatus Bathyarchaeota archaeon]|nr:thiamine-phosphate kinase [Candidatus Bathyarchaeota archaeon]MBS7617819.1 thiamine-phosphate kinase [Candidatus Bathyarchaeota archaeon]